MVIRINVGVSDVVGLFGEQCESGMDGELVGMELSPCRRIQRAAASADSLDLLCNTFGNGGSQDTAFLLFRSDAERSFNDGDTDHGQRLVDDPLAESWGLTDVV